MVYIVYQITNLLNGKIYIGCHRTLDINDGYMGSGLLIVQAIEKYGVDNFKKDILHVFDNADDMLTMELELVNEEFVNSSDTYNLKLGGEGGWEHLNDGSTQHIDRCKLAAKRKYEKYGKDHVTQQLKQARRSLELKYTSVELQLMRSKNRTPRKVGEYKHTNATRKKISEGNKNRGRGSSNSQHGTCWVYFPATLENRKIKTDQLSQFLEDGWVKGRKLYTPVD